MNGEERTVTLTVTVTESNTADALGSGLLPVFATPSMIALMENASAKCAEPLLGEGETTVGTELNVKHVSATPIGMEVRCESTLTAADGRRLTFAVRAYDECGLIGEGTHERFIVKSERFLSKANAKRDGRKPE